MYVIWNIPSNIDEVDNDDDDDDAECLFCDGNYKNNENEK